MMSKYLFILLILFTACRSRKVHRTSSVVDSVVTKQLDSTHVKIVEENNYVLDTSNSEYEAKIYFNPSAQPFIKDSAGVRFYGGVDSVLLKEKNTAKKQTQSTKKDTDSTTVAAAETNEKHVVQKAKDVETKPSYTWMYVVASILLLLALIVWTYKKIKRFYDRK